MEKSHLHAEVYTTCDEGEDQTLSATLQLLTMSAPPVATLNIERGSNEQDDATLKTGANLPALTLPFVQSLALSASTRPATPETVSAGLRQEQ
jgi:hypothetical protein